MNFNEGIARFYDKFLGDRGKEKELQGISFCSHASTRFDPSKSDVWMSDYLCNSNIIAQWGYISKCFSYRTQNSLAEPHINPCYHYISHPSLKLKSLPWRVSSRDLLFLCQNPPYFCFLSLLPVLLLWLQPSKQISEQAACILHKVTIPFSHQDLILRFRSSIRLTRINIKIKIIIIIILKFNLKIEPRYGQGHEWGWPLTQVNTRTKMIIIIVFKLDSKINSGKARVTCEESKSGLT